MCIIAAKPSGIDMPGKDLRRNMWNHNSDGAGFMYVKDGKVIIEKGFMKLKELEKRLDKLSREVDFKKTPMVLHFRITTHGGTSPENTHPFPVTDSLAALRKCRNACTLGVAHNGIIDIRTPKDRSDTMQYIATQLAPLRRALPRFYENKDALQLIKNAIDSRMAFLTSDGTIITVGDFVESGGIQYSNKSFEGYSRYYGFECDWYGDDGWTAYSGYSGKTTKKSASESAKTIIALTDDEAMVELDTEDNGYYIESDAFMWLDNVEGYVINSEGELDDGSFYLIDRDDHVYEYDFDIDAAVLALGCTAYTGSGTIAHFVEDLASIECVAIPADDEDDEDWYNNATCPI